MRQISVALGDGRDYPIHIGAGLLGQPHVWAKPFCRLGAVAVISEPCVWELHGAALEAALKAGGWEPKLFLVPQGEQAKSFSQLEKLTSWLLAQGVLRGDTIIGFGGGAVGDSAGLAAGLVRRGVGIIHIPTTLLAQIDSAIGGKTAINTAQGKNLVGLFHQPQAVVADSDVLDTLPKRELLAGYGELVKYALIDGEDFFQFLEREGEAILSGAGAAREEAVGRAMAIKAAIVAEDEREAGKRALLNLGHTFAHGLEAATGGEGALLHGEAVAMGLYLAARLSHKLALCSAEEVERIKNHLVAMGFDLRPDWGNKPPTIAQFRHFLAQDKKATAEGLVFILLEGIGRVSIRPLKEDALLDEVLRDDLGLRVG